MPNKTGPSRGPGVGCLGLAIVGLIILVFIGLSISWPSSAPPGGGSEPCEWEKVKTLKRYSTHSLIVSSTITGTKPRPGGGGSGASKPRPQPNRGPSMKKTPTVPQKPTQRLPQGYQWHLDCD